MKIENRPLPLQALAYRPEVRSSARLIGDVELILNSRCDLAQLRRISQARFALGGAAIARNAVEALQQIGEFLCVDGIPLWTPAGRSQCRPLMALRESAIFTPFLIDWDGALNAVYSFDRMPGTDMPTVYRSLFDELKLAGVDLTAALVALVILAETGTKQVVDKVMAISPTLENAPHNGEQIIHPSNIDHYFRWNLTQSVCNHSEDEPAVFLLMVGVGVDGSSINEAIWQPLLSRAFYTTPGMALTATELIHNHAVALGSSISFERLREHVASGQQDMAGIATNLIQTATPDNILSMIHIENNTLLQRGLIGVGIIPLASLDYGR